MPRRRGPTRFQTLGELEEIARRSVDAAVWGYVQGGAGAERTCRRNEAAFDGWSLRAAPLSGVRSVDLTTAMLGRSTSAPFFVAPTAYHREVHPDGEVGTATAAAELGVLSAFSTLSSGSLEEIAGVRGSAPRWFQLYLQRRPAQSLELVRRAERAGYAALVVTVDVPVFGARDRQVVSGFATRSMPALGNGPGVSTPARGPSWDGGPYRLSEAADNSWAALRQIARGTSLPLVVKGVLDPAEARRAVDLGARAVIVSNHGGRQLDLAPATLEVLPSIVAELREDAEVYLDGGVRRGSDVAVALALGARAVGLGRPVLWALAAGGRSGVRRYLEILGTELANCLVMLGCRTPSELDRSRLDRWPPRTIPRSGGRRGRSSMGRRSGATRRSGGGGAERSGSRAGTRGG